MANDAGWRIEKTMHEFAEWCFEENASIQFAQWISSRILKMKTPYLILKIQDEEELREEMKKKTDEFLDVFSLYVKTRISWVRDEVRLKAYELHLLDPSFSFQI